MFTNNRTNLTFSFDLDVKVTNHKEAQNQESQEVSPSSTQGDNKCCKEPTRQHNKTNMQYKYEKGSGESAFLRRLVCAFVA